MIYRHTILVNLLTRVKEHFISQNALPVLNFCSKFHFLSCQFKFQFSLL